MGSVITVHLQIIPFCSYLHFTQQPNFLEEGLLMLATHCHKATEGVTAHIHN